MAVIRATQIEPLESFEKLLERLHLLEQSLGEDRPKNPAVRMPAVAPAEPKASASKIEIKPTAEAEPTAAVQPTRSEAASVKTEAETPKRPGGTGLPMEQWSRVVKRFLHEKPNLGSYLEKGVVQDWIAGEAKDVLVIGYDEGAAFFAEFIQKEESRPIIASALREVFQRPVELKVVRLERSGLEQLQVKLKKDQQEQQHRKRIQQETMAHPLVKEALNVLGGEVIDIKES
jgi:hypothetical protein